VVCWVPDHGVQGVCSHSWPWCCVHISSHGAGVFVQYLATERMFISLVMVWVSMFFNMVLVSMYLVMVRVSMYVPCHCSGVYVHTWL
jgi:hypothetical protein